LIIDSGGFAYIHPTMFAGVIYLEVGTMVKERAAKTKIEAKKITRKGGTQLNTKKRPLKRSVKKP
jgi:hypothetical protein